MPSKHIVVETHRTEGSTAGVFDVEHAESLPMKTLLDPPRWKGGPNVCPTANLMAFENHKGVSDFLDANSPGSTMIAEWTCTVCGFIHFWSVATGPSGASSGTTRTAKHIDSIRARFFKSKVTATMPARAQHNDE